MPETPDPPSARYFALLYSPGPQRLVLEALLGIEREVSESLRAGLDHQVAHSRLQWWREECERTVEGRPEHPLTRALSQAMGGAKPTGLSGLVDLAVWDLAGATFESRRELSVYCERWSAAMIEPIGAPLAAATSGLESASALAPTSALASTSASESSSGAAGNCHVRTLGAVIHEIELLSDLEREAHRGRLRIPLDELERHKTEPGALAMRPWPETVVDLLRSRHNALRTDLARAVGGLGGEMQSRLRGVLVWAALAARSSRRHERALPNRAVPTRFDPVTDAWFAWRQARKATMGRFRLD